jgi:hypothetical protein
LINYLFRALDIIIMDHRYHPSTFSHVAGVWKVQIPQQL